MKLVNKDYLAAVIIAIILTIAIFWQFFIKGLYPFPANYMLAWYEPWKSDHVANGAITIAHKPVADDTFRYIYPFKVLGMDILKGGGLPLWNPYGGSGMPLFATIQSGFLNPLNILFLFLENRVAWTLYIILQALFLSFFTYLYCRKIKISIAGSLFTTTAFLFSGFVIARLVFGNIIYPLVALPLLLYLVEIFFEDSKSKKIYFIPLIVAFSIFSGHPHITFYVLVFSFSYFLYKILTTKGKNKIFRTVFFTLLVLLGVGLTGIQIIPAIELLANANINFESSRFIFERFLLPPYHLISTLIPNYFGNQGTYNYWGAGDYIETVASIGIIPCFFAYIAFLKGHNLKKDVRPFFFISLLITLVSTLNWFLPKLFFSLPIPVIATSPPSRIFILTTFSIAILAGYGFDRWFSFKKLDKNILYKCGLFIFAILALFLSTFYLYFANVSCNNSIIYNCRLIALRNTSLETFFFVVILGLLFVYFFFKKNSRIHYVPYIIIFFVLVLGLYNSNKTLPFSPYESILQNHPLVETLQSKMGIYRVFGFDSANIKTNLATHFRFYDPNYYDPLYIKRYGELVTYSNAGEHGILPSRSDVEITSEATISARLAENRNRLFALLNVKYLIYKKPEVPVGPNDIIWQDNNWHIQKQEVPERAYLVNNYEIIDKREDILDKLFDKDFSPFNSVILEEKPLNLPNDIRGKIGEVKIKKYDPNKISIEVNAASDAILVLSDNYYPGWKAYVDGEETKIYRANYTFRAIILSSGNHNVIFKYQPESLKIGILISLFSFLSLIIIYLRYKLTFKNA